MTEESRKKELHDIAESVRVLGAAVEHFGTKLVAFCTGMRVHTQPHSEDRLTPERAKELRARLLAKVQETPGLSRGKLAAAMGASPRQTGNLLAILKKDGLVAIQGSRASAVYLPAP